MDYSNVLILEDDPRRRQSMAQQLQHNGCSVEVAEDRTEAYRKLNTSHFDAILTCRQGLTKEALEFLDQLNAAFPDLPVVLYPSGLEAPSLGFTSRTVHRPVAAAQTATHHGPPQPIGPGAEDETVDGYGLVGRDVQIARVRELIALVADSFTPVLITGENGTGKSVVAHAIHRLSSRREGPFVEVSCAALPPAQIEEELFGRSKLALAGAVDDEPGKLDLAAGGTLFLDEVSALTPALQIKLLQVLQDRTFCRVGGRESIQADVRVLIATTLDLKKAVEEGAFRQDLYYRVSVLPIELPPLRCRKGDIEMLAQHFLARYGEANGKPGLRITPEAIDLCRRYTWPGNVRELENLMERCAVLAQSEWITPDLLPPEVRLAQASATDGPVKPLKVALEGPEKALIENALDTFRWHRGKTAEALKIDRTTLYQKMKKYGLLGKKK